MSLFAIGDVHGCRHTLQRLLAQLSRHRRVERLWFVGDLVNRGPHSLATLRLVRELGDRAVTVLGNHDLRLIRMAIAGDPHDPRGLLCEIFDAEDASELIDWLRHRPLLHREAGWTMVHAGLLPGWTIVDAEARAREIETVLRGQGALELLERHRASAEVWERMPVARAELAAALSALTRLRFCNAGGDSDPRFDGTPDQAPDGMVPWYEHPARRSRGEPIVFGHWSSLGFLRRSDALGIDTACARGGHLTAVCLLDGTVYFEPRDRRDEPGA